MSYIKLSLLETKLKGRKDLVSKHLELGGHQLMVEINQLSSAINANNVEDAQRAIHKLKSLLGYFYQEDLVALLEKIKALLEEDAVNEPLIQEHFVDFKDFTSQLMLEMKQAVDRYGRLVKR